MNTDLLYPMLKTLHIGALVLWLGPTLGSWWLLQRGRAAFGETSDTTHALYRLFLRTLWVEHLALAVLLGTGAALAVQFYGLTTSWLQLKLALVLAVILPLEALDIWLGHVRLPRLFAQQPPGTTFDGPGERLLAFYHRRFTPLALVLLPPVIALVLWLAVYKPL